MNNFFNCEKCVNLLMDYLEGNLAEDVHKKLDEHMSVCAPCINFLRTYRDSAFLTQKLKDQQVEVPREVQSRLKSFLKAEIVALQESGRGDAD